MRSLFPRLALLVVLIGGAAPAAAQFQADLVAELVPGPGAAEVLYSFTTFDDRLFFIADVPGFGRELWAYDAATDEVELVADLNPGPPSAFTIGVLVPLDGRLYFNADDGTAGLELFVYDPATDAVTLVDDTTPGEQGFTIQLIAYDDRLFFTGQFLLWAYDPATDEVTNVINDIAGFGVVGNLTVFDDRLFFSVFNFETGAEPAFYDAATDTRAIVTDLVPGPDSSQPFVFTSYDERLFFSATTPATGRELWVYDPVTESVELAADVAPGPTGAEAIAFTVFDGRLFFGAFADPVAQTGRNVWAYDAATDEAELVVDLDPDDATSTVGSSGFPYAGSLILPGTASATGEELYAYDPATEAVTLAAGEIVPGPTGASLGGVALYDGRLFFGADDGVSGHELWALSALTTDAEPQPQGRPLGLGVPYPNPASDLVTLDLTVDGSHLVRADVYDTLGRRVATLRNRSDGGSEALWFETSGWLPGTYVVRVTVGDVVVSRRFTVIR